MIQLLCLNNIKLSYTIKFIKLYLNWHHLYEYLIRGI